MKNTFQHTVLALTLGITLSACSTTDEETPLSSAAFGAHCNDESKIKALQLIQKGVDKEQAYDALWTCRDAEVVQALIDRGADVNKRDERGNLPINMALTYQEYDVCKTFVQNGFDIRLRNALGISALERIKGFSINEYDELLAEADKNTQLTALHKAAQAGNIKAAKQALAAGASVHATEKHGETPLHTAANAGNAALADILIQNGASVAAKDMDGRTPLHLAAKENPRIVQLLVAKGADVNAKDSFGMTPLHIATAHGTPQVILYLLQSGAKVNEQNNCGRTPLHYTPLSLSITAAEILLTYGADKTIRDDDGNCPVQLIDGRTDYPELEELLEAPGIKRF